MITRAAFTLAQLAGFGAFMATIAMAPEFTLAISIWLERT